MPKRELRPGDCVTYAIAQYLNPRWQARRPEPELARGRGLIIEVGSALARVLPFPSREGLLPKPTWIAKAYLQTAACRQIERQWAAHAVREIAAAEPYPPVAERILVALDIMLEQPGRVRSSRRSPRR